MMTATTTPKTTIRPHGGRLVDRWVTDAAEIRRIEMEARSSPAVTLDERGLADLEMIASGAYSPLTGFMGRADYDAVVEGLRLADGLPWTIPITLAVPAETAARCAAGAGVALRDARGMLYGLLRVGEVYQVDPAHEAHAVYGTRETRHPGVADLLARPVWRVGGVVDAVRQPPHPGFQDVLLEPRETRVVFAARGWRRVVAFQTRNPVHRAHEYIQKCALETCDGLLLHPLVGATKEDDVPARVRLRCYRALPAGPRGAGGLPGGHALRRPARGGAPRAGAQELRVHAHHHRPRPRRRRRLLRHLRRPAHLRPLRSRRARHHAAVLRPRLLLPRVRRHGDDEDLS